MGRFVGVCRRGLKLNGSKSKVIVMNGEEGLECEPEVHIDEVCLEHVSEFKYLGCVRTKQVQIGQNVVGRWQVGGGWQVLSGP